jgi:hypothetical protein
MGGAKRYIASNNEHPLFMQSDLNHVPVIKQFKEFYSFNKTWHKFHARDYCNMGPAILPYTIYECCLIHFPVVTEILFSQQEK